MQFKTIKKVVQDKMNEWLESIDDSNLREDVRNNLLVSGGSICSLIQNEQVNDYDIYIQDMNVLLRLTKYYCKGIIDEKEIWDGRDKDYLIDNYKIGFTDEEFENYDSMVSCALRNLQKDQIKIFVPDGGMKVDLISQIKEGEEKDSKYKVSYISCNAISLTDDIQIVVRFNGNPEQIHKTFDFIHATNYFTFKEGLVTNIKALESILSKQLYYQGSLYPLTSVIRAKKFIKRGWNISASEYLKMIFQCSNLDLTNLDVLEEQLIGIDVAYFSHLIEILRKHKENNSDFKLSSEYLCTILGKIQNGEE